MENSGPTVRNFVRAVGHKWFTAMSGPLSVPLAFFALFLENVWLKMLFGLLAIVCAFFASFWVWRTERLTNQGHEISIRDLKDRLLPKLVVVMNDCCRHSQLGRVAVENPNPVTVDDARVHIDVPGLQIVDRQVAWNGQGFQSLSLHHGSHYHTDVIVSVGDNAGQFYVHFPNGNQSVAPGTYEATLRVSGRGTMAKSARLHIVFALPRQLSFTLQPEN